MEIKNLETKLEKDLATPDVNRSEHQAERVEGGFALSEHLRQGESFSESSSNATAERAATTPATIFIDPQFQAIEKILEEDLESVYFSLPDENIKRQFKQKGEETALAILDLMAKPKFKAKKIIDLIIGWLKIIPGINKFFLEQEAKIKTDKILKLGEK